MHEGILLTIVMETKKYMCAQSFISMCTIVGKFEKWKPFVCHGGDVLCVLSFIPICITISLL